MSYTKVLTKLHVLASNFQSSPSGERWPGWSAGVLTCECVPTIATIATIAPEAAVEALRNGKTMDLGVQAGSEWVRAMLAIYDIYQIDQRVARQAVQQHYDKIASGFTFPSTYPECEH
ncbi:MAG TPA: hypothetical protein VF826_11265 [Chloroflexia bacterium]